MITFIDGPAAGTQLQLHRAPFLLRAVFSTEWDALDQLDDEAADDETIVVYERCAKAQMVHFNPGGWYSTADYRVFADPPEDKYVRTTRAWQTWCKENDDAIRRRTTEAAKPGTI